ncbi:gene transfer agent family protein [Maritalea sp.]|uniref:gene transfer agent family protein n=1 Tax=Maritalea sp. TaxID=2003361 RepID=UPI003EFADD29
MSRHGLIVQPWGDRSFAFRLGLDEIELIESQLNRSIFEVVQAIHDRAAKTSDLRLMLLAGLIGGGMAHSDAAQLVDSQLDISPIEDSRDLAYVIGLAGLARATPEELEDQEPGKSVGARLSALILPIFGWLLPADRSRILAD